MSRPHKSQKKGCGGWEVVMVKTKIRVLLRSKSSSFEFSELDFAWLWPSRPSPDLDLDLSLTIPFLNILDPTDPRSSWDWGWLNNHLEHHPITFKGSRCEKIGKTQSPSIYLWVSRRCPSSWFPIGIIVCNKYWSKVPFKKVLTFTLDPSGRYGLEIPFQYRSIRVWFKARLFK